MRIFSISKQCKNARVVCATFSVCIVLPTQILGRSLLGTDILPDLQICLVVYLYCFRYNPKCVKSHQKLICPFFIHEKKTTIYPFLSKKVQKYLIIFPIAFLEPFEAMCLLYWVGNPRHSKAQNRMTKVAGKLVAIVCT